MPEVVSMMIGASFFLIVSMGASVIGSLCGLGGGIIIKPLLDMIGAFDIGTVGFLSSCTVLAMSGVSVFLSLSRGKSTGDGTAINLAAATPLAIGSVVGGALGQEVFQTLRLTVGSAYVGASQSFMLFFTTFAALLYTLFFDRLAKKKLSGAAPAAIAGVLLGVVSSFIGIGGGPINIMVLSYLFSMGTKEAAANSLYVVMFSQGAGLAHTLISGAVPDFDPATLALMMAGGVSGALLGRRINKIIPSSGVRAIYIALMIGIIFMSCKNFHAFVS